MVNLQFQIPQKGILNNFILKISLILIFAFCGVCSISYASFVSGDFDGNCQVGIDDLALTASQWLGEAVNNESGLIAYWKFDETSGAVFQDSSGSGYDGILSGPAWNSFGGVFGGALQFDGSDFVWITQGYQGVSGSNPRSCSLWIKTDQPTGHIISWGDMTVDSNSWVISLDESGVLRVDVGGGYVLGKTFLTDDLWHHITVASDGTVTDNIVLYVDGIAETNGDDFVSQVINTQGGGTLKIGNSFIGLIDDARIYNRVLNLNEVWALATNGSTNRNSLDTNYDNKIDLNDFSVLSKSWFDQYPTILINEILTDNNSKSPLEHGEILDGNLDSSDWIELYNNFNMPVDLGGWYLTDDPDNKTMWQFPSGNSNLILQPGGYLLVFASGKSLSENPGNYPYVDPAGYLHTNFTLASGGEYLALVAADGVSVVHEYNHIELSGGNYGYPKQKENISYGYFYNQMQYFSFPTPGADNRDSAAGFTDKPEVSIKGGCYVDAFDLVLSCDTPDSFIRYTTDGTVPSLVSGQSYSAPIHLENITTIIAKSFKPGLHSSDALIETYIFIEPDVAQFNSNLPIIVVDTLGVDLPHKDDSEYDDPYTDCRVVVVDVNEATGRTVPTDPEQYEGWGMIKRRGESTYGQGHYGLEIQDEYRNDNDVSLLGMPAESDWVLSYDVIDYSMMKNEIVFKWFRDMGHYAPRQRYVELYMNTDGGKISAGDYRGLFMLREKIKRSKNRVDIDRLDTSHNLEPKVSGGYIIKCDKYNVGDTLLSDYLEVSPYGINVNGGGKPILSEPAPKDLTPPQLEWIAGYLNETNSVLWQNPNSSFYPGSEYKYTDYIDVESWIDHGIVEQIASDSDAFWGSYYTYKDRNGIIHSGPTWDYDRSFHNNGGSYYQSYDSWRENGDFFGKWHMKLQEDLEYKMLLADRWFEHRKEVLNTDLTMQYIDQTIDLINESRSRPKKYYPYSFAQENIYFKEWITNRLNWLDGEIVRRFAAKPPLYSLAGGYVGQDSSLAISKPSGVSAGNIFYTLNGEDPRLQGGTLNHDAMLFADSTSGISESLVSMSSSVWKYLYNGTGQESSWRTLGFNDSSWPSGRGQLGFGDGDEATDIGPKVNYYFTAYFRHVFNVNDVASLNSLYINLLYDDGAVIYINGQEVKRIEMPGGEISYNTPTTGNSSDNKTTSFSVPVSVLNEGDNVIAVEVHQLNYSSTDMSFDLGMSAQRSVTPSLITLDKSACVKSRIKDGNSWSALNSETYAVGPVNDNLRVTEIMYHPADTNTEYIELKNIGTESINLNMVEFTKGVDFVFGDVVVPAGGYVLIVQDIDAFTDKYGGDPIVAGQYTGSLDNGGENIRLKDPLDNIILEFEYKDGWYELTDGSGFSLSIRDAASTDITLWNTKSGWRSSAFSGGSPGQDDNGYIPELGSIVINEVLAHSHADAPDWIELHNTTDGAIDIGGWFLSDSNLDVTNIKKYEIPLYSIVPAYGYLVFYQDEHFNNASAPGCHTPFALSEGGDDIYLHSGYEGTVTGYFVEESFDASASNVAFGRYYKASTDSWNFVAMKSNTPNHQNSLPKVGPIVISEIMYNPPAGGSYDHDDYEYIELSNITDQSVNLWEYDDITGAKIGWALTEGIDYIFNTNVSIPAGGSIVVVKKLNAFAQRYPSVPASKVFGPYDGKLDNGGEKVDLSMPGDEEQGERYYIRIDRVNYDDTTPWPVSPDGSGTSLNRIDNSAYGNDFINWQADTASPGY